MCEDHNECSLSVPNWIRLPPNSSFCAFVLFFYHVHFILSDFFGFSTSSLSLDGTLDREIYNGCPILGGVWYSCGRNLFCFLSQRCSSFSGWTVSRLLDLVLYCPSLLRPLGFQQALICSSRRNSPKCMAGRFGGIAFSPSLLFFLCHCRSAALLFPWPHNVTGLSTEYIKNAAP